MRTPVELPWLIDNDRVTRWYYRDAPSIGAVVHYANESYIDYVERVTLTHVWLTSGTAMRRPYIARRLVRWSINTIRNRPPKSRRTTYVATSLPSSVQVSDWSASIV